MWSFVSTDADRWAPAERVCVCAWVRCVCAYVCACARWCVVCAYVNVRVWRGALVAEV